MNYIIALSLLLFLSVTCFAQDAYEYEVQQETALYESPDSYTGANTLFEISNADRFIVVTSDETVDLVLNANADKVLMRLYPTEGGQTLSLDISGLEAHTTYYQYEWIDQAPIELVTSATGTALITVTITEPTQVLLTSNPLVVE